MSAWINRVLMGSCERMTEIPDASVHCCVTSPPYYGLRDYATGWWDGGDASCDHSRATSTKVGASTLAGTLTNGNNARTGWIGGRCGKCGAQRISDEIGGEPTVAEYVERLLAIGREIHRVLREDGTLWLNLGDSYATSGTRQGNRHGNYGLDRDDIPRRGYRPLQAEYKEKDLMGVPWRVAFALQADGWYLRDAIVWAKTNAMPSSVADRCTSSYEMVFMLAKSRRYYADMASVKQPDSGRPSGNNYVRPERISVGRGSDEEWLPGEGSNLRNVWTISTRPYRGDHPAVMPSELASRCIAIGSPPGGIVLDPFMGSGTVAECAIHNGRQFTGYELNPTYHAEIANRLGLFAAESAS